MTTSFLPSLTSVPFMSTAREVEVNPLDEAGHHVLRVSVEVKPGRLPTLVWELSSTASHHGELNEAQLVDSVLWMG